MFTFNDLIQYQQKGFRNGSWWRLSFIDRMFFKASIHYAKSKGIIVNSKVIEELKSVIEKLIPFFKKRVLKEGFKKVREMVIIFKETNVFDWAPEIIKWLKDHKYIYWLGHQMHEEWLTS